MNSIFRRHTITVTRTAHATYVDGRAVRGTSSQFTIRASVQFGTGTKLMNNPEGRGDGRDLILFTDTKLLTNTDAVSPAADSFEWDGATYQVTKCEPWQNQIIPHYRIIGELVR